MASPPTTIFVSSSAADRGPAVGALKPISICCILPCIASLASMRHHAAASGWRQADPAMTCDLLRAETTDHDGGRWTGEAAAVRNAAGRTDGGSSGLARFRARPADFLLAQGLHSAYQTLPGRLSLLHVRAGAAPGQADLPLTRRGARHRARGRGRRLHRSAVHAGRQARTALPGRARGIEG